MKTNHIMCISKTLPDIRLVKQKAKIKNTFAKAAYSALVTKIY